MPTYDWSSTDPPRGLWAEAWRPAVKLAVIYGVMATAWIVLTDGAINLLVDNKTLTHQLHTLKGIGFVVTTGVLLSVLAYRRLASLTRSRAELARSRRVLNTLLSNLPGMAYRCQPDAPWQALIVSEGVKQLTGHDATAFLTGAMSLNDLIHEDDREMVRHQVAEAIAKASPYRIEYRMPHADGSLRWVWEQGQPIYTDAGELEALEGFITDITDRKRAEQLENERRHLVEARRAMERELGVIGHEMRTPLASLRAVAELLITDPVSDIQQQEQLLRAIHDETLRMTEMANNMLETSRLRESAVASPWEEVSLRELCQSAAAVIRPLLNPTRVSLQTHVEPADLTIRGDFSSLRRLLINLLSNAARHTHCGSIRVDVRSSEDELHGQWVHFRVQDTGAGIPPERAKKLGIAFALHHGQDDHSGAGLGLTICRDIAASHGGTISFDTRPGAGTTFHVRLLSTLDGPRLPVGPYAREHEPVAIAAAVH
ncbi:MAG: PAS domain-containing sensor histidine kinase [Phycisphaeraceae bacterium]